MADIDIRYIPVNEWERYLPDLFKESENYNQRNNLPELRHKIEINRQELGIAINSVKNRESPEHDGITNGLLKYGGERVILELTKLIQKIIYFTKYNVICFVLV